MVPIRFFGLGFLLLLLAACRSGPPATLEERVGAYQWREVSPGDSLFVMPAGAEEMVVGSWKRSWDNAIEQRSSLYSNSILPGESYLSLSLFARPLDITELFSLGQSLSPTSYSDLGLPRRLRQEFPGLSPELAREPRLNRYGIYYYATARYGDELCVFAWQVLDSTSGTLPPHLRRVELEYRLCRSGDPKMEDLLMPFEEGLVRPDTGVLPRGGLRRPMSRSLPREARQNLPGPSAASTTSASSFPLPVRASPTLRTSSGGSGGSSSASSGLPRRLFNGRPQQMQAPAANPSRGAFPLPKER